MNNNGIEQRKSQLLTERLEAFVEDLVVELDRYLDKRLVRTLVLLMQAIVKFRHREDGLLLSELGGYILRPSQAPAGAKRISNLLHSEKWTYRMIARFLWRRADERVTDRLGEKEEAVVVWDESVWEKPESIASEGLCAVRSSKAQRLKRIKKGYYNPPGGRPIHVPGLHWVCLLVVGMKGAPTLAAMRWWSTRGKFATTQKVPRERLLKLCARWWGQAVIHVWDRGYGHEPWLNLAFQYHVRFVVRWKKTYHLVDTKGARNAWKITRGKRSLDHRLIWDARRQCDRKTGIYYCQVAHPYHLQYPLWLVVVRPKGQKPIYLLTNEVIQDLNHAWRIAFIYMRRWQVEQTFRFAKSELAMQSPRLWHWHTRLKLLMIVALVYAFLISLMQDHLLELRLWLLRTFAHRTGKRHLLVKMPLYRLRSALSRLWLEFSSAPHFAWQNSG